MKGSLPSQVIIKILSTELLKMSKISWNKDHFSHPHIHVYIKLLNLVRFSSYDLQQNFKNFLATLDDSLLIPEKNPVRYSNHQGTKATHVKNSMINHITHELLDDSGLQAVARELWEQTAWLCQLPALNSLTSHTISDLNSFLSIKEEVR